MRTAGQGYLQFEAILAQRRRGPIEHQHRVGPKASRSLAPNPGPYARAELDAELVEDEGELADGNGSQ